MEKKQLSQEMLKLIACVTMLIDHIGAVFIPGAELRIIGRIAFPIYCFLMAEGVHYTRNPGRYGLRLLIGAILSEVPFDLLFFGRLTLAHQSVMVTLLLGFAFAVAAKRAQTMRGKLLLVVPFFVAAELLMTDYGGFGVAMIALFVLTRDMPNRHVVQILGLLILSWYIGGMTVAIGPVRMPIQLFAMGALVPIFCYSGRKGTKNLWIQRAFYLFYPAHLAVLFLVKGL